MTLKDSPVPTPTKVGFRLAFQYAEEDAESSFWASTGLRFVLPSVLVVLLLTGGVVWLRSLPAGTTSTNSSGAIQVRLLQSPEPSPVALQSPGSHSSPSLGQHSDEPPRPVNPTSSELPSAQEDALAPVPDRTAAPDVEAVSHTFSAPPNATMAKFQRALMQHIARFERYPARSGRNRPEGTVQVAFVMRRDGRIADVWVKSSSGQVELDQEAVASLRRAEPLPPIPTDLPDQLSVLAPISFAAQ